MLKNMDMDMIIFKERLTFCENQYKWRSLHTVKMKKVS